MRKKYGTDLKFKNKFRMSYIDFDKDFLFPGEIYPVICAIWLHGEEEVNYLLEHPKTYIKDTTIFI